MTGHLGRDWRRAAACAGVDPEVFYPLDSGPDGPALVERAKWVCAGCPVRVVCLADVMAAEDPARRWGVIGGLSPAERAELFDRRRPGRLSAPVTEAAARSGGEAA